MKDIKILVIGGAGYTGSVLVYNLIQSNYSVTVVDIFKNEENVFNNLFHKKNLIIKKKDFRDLDEKFYKDFDIIFPLAALVGAPICSKYPEEAKQINFLMIKNLVQSLSKHQFLIYPMTNSGYGSKEANVECDENTPLEPISLYGSLKKQSEDLILSRENSISFRLATVFGVSPRHRIDLLVNDFVYKACTERLLVLYEQNFKRNYIHVQDVANAYIFAIKNFSKLRGNIFNLGLSTANLSKKELALEIKKFILDLNIISSEISNDPDKRNYIVSNKKIEKAGFIPKFSIQDGIKELINYYAFLSKKNSNI